MYHSRTAEMRVWSLFLTFVILHWQIVSPSRAQGNDRGNGDGADESQSCQVDKDEGGGQAGGESAETKKAETLSLPEPGAGGVQKLELGKSVQLNSLGPIIVNSDGTTRRIVNWENLTDRERAWTLKRISKRNKERIQTLSKKVENKPES